MVQILANTGGFTHRASQAAARTAATHTDAHLRFADVQHEGDDDESRSAQLKPVCGSINVKKRPTYIKKRPIDTGIKRRAKDDEMRAAVLNSS